jgi:hypothetical protein
MMHGVATDFGLRERFTIRPTRLPKTIALSIVGLPLVAPEQAPLRSSASSLNIPVKMPVFR